MNSNSEYGDNVGYKKPPKATRFEKGKSGNPSGRPKTVIPQFNLGSILQAIENEEVIVFENGKRKMMRKVEAHLLQLFTKGIKGDLKAARILMTITEDYFAPAAIENRQNEFIGVSDARRRFGKNWRKKVDELNAGLTREQ